ncbi:hypothetical protein BGX26_000622 [Mortierella sp. AD094]|nr:hypothetical protein BGX26_000622 [Mortierella sp. AD094]
MVIGETGIRNPSTIEEVVFLAPVLEKVDFQHLLRRLVEGFNQSPLLDPSTLEGLAQLIQGAGPSYLETDDLVRILGLINSRLQTTHSQSPKHIYRLTQAVSNVLDAMSDSRVEGLDRVELHEPLFNYLKDLQGSGNTYLAYQAAYASQALFYVPDNETPWEKILRRGGKVLGGVFGMVSAVKSVDVNGFIEGLKKIQDGMAGAGEILSVAKDACDEAASIYKSGQELADSLKEGFRFDRKKQWYTALRGADVLLQSVPSLHPLRVASLPRVRGAQSLLSVVQNKADFEIDLLRLKRERLEDKRNSIYIPPQAKANLKARDDALFSLMEKVKDFLKSKQEVFLILGDSGAGKSTFNKTLERDLWEIYKKGDSQVPLHIRLSEIDKPEHDLIAKQLSRNQFTKQQIREMKEKCVFILICDGCDESTQTNNLYTCNRLNQPGEWRAKMIISCRTEYLGRGYLDKFQTSDRNNKARPDLFQEAVIAPFTPMQIQDYIRQYKLLEEKPLLEERPLWEEADYDQSFKRIPNLQELVKNPFLLAMSLEVLPIMVDLQKDVFSTVRVNQISLYDQFLKVWLKRGKKRLQEKTKSEQEQKAFRCLDEDDFMQNGIEHFKRLAVVMYEAGIMVVEYNRAQHKTTWEGKFFGQDDEMRLLLEACPISRSGNVYRFIHRSIQEYGVARAIFEPTESENSAGFDSGYGEQDVRGDEEMAIIGQPLLDTVLARQDFAKESSILQFLAGRALREPLFRRQLHAVIRYSKVDESDKKASRAAANAITVLVRAGVSFNGADLRGIRIPGADLGYGVFDSANLQGANLKDVVLRNVWLREANLSGAQMEGVQFGELPFLQVLRGHSHEVLGVTYSPNGNQVASASKDGTARLWDVETGKCRQILDGHSDSVNRAIYSPKGDLIASSSDDNTVRLWDVETGECLNLFEGHGDDVLGIAFSPKGNQIASGSFDSTVRLWDIETGKCIHVLKDHGSRVYSVAYSLDGGQIASSSFDKTVRLWDAKTGDCDHILKGHDDCVVSVAYSPKGDQIATGGWDETVRLWEVETGKFQQPSNGHSKGVKCVAYSPERDQVASGSKDETVRLWDVKTGECCHILRGHTGVVTSVDYSPKGDQIASGGYDRIVRLWDVKNGEFLCYFKGHTDIISAVSFSPAGDRIATGGWDSKVRLWRVEDQQCLHTIEGGRNWVASAMYSPKGDLVVGGIDDHTVRLWDVDTGKSCRILKGHTGSVWAVAFSHSGDQMASGSEDCRVLLWDINTNKCLHTLEGHTKRVVCVAYSPAGDMIVSSSEDRTMRLWDVTSGDCKEVIENQGVVNMVAWKSTADGTYLVTGSDDASVRLWRLVKDGDRYILRLC